MVACDKQLTEAYLGTPENKGQFADTLLATARFLVEQKRLPKALTREEFGAFLAPEYLQKAIK